MMHTWPGFLAPSPSTVGVTFSASTPRTLLLGPSSWMLCSQEKSATSIPILLVYTLYNAELETVNRPKALQQSNPPCWMFGGFPFFLFCLAAQNHAKVIGTGDAKLNKQVTFSVYGIHMVHTQNKLPALDIFGNSSQLIWCKNVCILLRLFFRFHFLDF